MKLERLTERIWYYPFEPERDRPNLAYIRGNRWSLAEKLAEAVASTSAETCLEGHWTPDSREGAPSGIPWGKKDKKTSQWGRFSLTHFLFLRT